MKKLITGLFLVGSMMAVAGEFRDGTYRGVFISGQETQVEVQFKMKNDIISNTKFRTLFYKGKDFLKSEDVKDQKERFEAALKFTEGKNINKALNALYTPEDIPRAGASVRATKIRAAMKNAVNSGAYKLD